MNYHKTALWGQVKELVARREALLHVSVKQKPHPAAIGQVADRIGVSKATVWRWEEGKVRPHRLFVNRWLEVIAELETEIGGSHGTREND